MVNKAMSRVPKNLGLFLKETFDLKIFVETGTFEGLSSNWASKYFEQVHTLELYEPYFKAASERFADCENINFILGDSRTELIKVLDEIKEPAFLWLDAHWAKDADFGFEELEECPLREELEVVVSSGQKHFIAIDDARFFINPPKLPHHPEQWPSYTEIETILDGWELKVVQDRIIAIPKDAAEEVWAFISENDIALDTDIVKVFGIGLSRTGTTSLTMALIEMGYDAKHYPKALSIMKEAENHDALTDISVIPAYKDLSRKYPNAKFILTTRKIDSWLASCKAHWRKKNRLEGSMANLIRRAVYGTASFDPDLFSQAYSAHMKDVTNFFSGDQKDRLLIMDICAGEDYEKLCPFLGKPMIKGKFPHGAGGSLK